MNDGIGWDPENRLANLRLWDSLVHWPLEAARYCGQEVTLVWPIDHREFGHFRPEPVKDFIYEFYNRQESVDLKLLNDAWQWTNDKKDAVHLGEEWVNAEPEVQFVLQPFVRRFDYLRSWYGDWGHSETLLSVHKRMKWLDAGEENPLGGQVFFDWYEAVGKKYFPLDPFLKRMHEFMIDPSDDEAYVGSRDHWVSLREDDLIPNA